MEGNSIAVASSIPAPSVVTIISSLYNDSTDHSIVLETVLDESTIKAAEAIVALGSDTNSKSMYNYMEQGTTTSRISLAI
eukprot:5126201-Ditylum_brightwellii.AAC.1